MKRKDAYKPTKGRKKQRTHLKEIEFVYDQAEQYCLATAKFPVDALTPEWSIGTNKSTNEAHKRRLVYDAPWYQPVILPSRVIVHPALKTRACNAKQVLILSRCSLV
jgi:hypothetical protein